MVIREPRPEEAAEVAAFNRAMARETEGLDLDAGRALAGVRKVLDDPARGFYLVAEQGGRLVGQVLVTPEWSDWRDGFFWWVQSVYVLPGARRRGVLRALLEAVCARAARGEGVLGLRLYVHRANDPAREVYRRLGWRRADYEMYEREVAPPAGGGSPLPGLSGGSRE